jgi:DNA-binding transcriptional LysR family regulator
MDLRQLEMLLAVVERGGYERAGEQLHVSHSAVHRQIRLLEAELQDRVLVRVGRRMELTATGRLVVEGARRVKYELDQLLRRAREAKTLAAGQLRVGTGTTTLIFFLADVLDRFRREFPGIHVQATTGVGDVIVDGVISGGLDLGVVYAPNDIPRSAERVKTEVLYSDDFVLAVGHRHPLSGKRSITLDEAAKHLLIVYPPASHLRRHFERLFGERGLSLPVAMELENEEAMERMVAIGMGCAFLSRKRAIAEGIRHVSIRGAKLACDVGLVLPATDYLPHATRAFVRLCRDSADLQRRNACVGRKKE